VLRGVALGGFLSGVTKVAVEGGVVENWILPGVGDWATLEVEEEWGTGFVGGGGGEVLP